jgi:hypothetical protein
MKFDFENQLSKNIFTVFYAFLRAAYLPLNVVENQTSKGRLCWLLLGKM